MSGRPYITAGQLAELAASLGELDWPVLRDVAAMRLASARDLQALHALRGPLDVRQFRRRLQRLTERRLLFRLERRVGGVRAGSAGYVYGLDAAGQRLMAHGAGRRPWTPRPAWLRHALAASRLYVVLREAEADGALTLVDFQAEPEAWRSFGTATLKPDTFIRFETAAETVSAFVEIDCGSEAPRTIAGKALAYAAYWHSGTEQGAHGVFPEVLWLVPDHRRGEVLQSVLERQGQAARLHRVALQAEARAALIEPP